MKYLSTEIILDTISIDIAVLIFSILSLFCSIITILIYLRVKSLRTIIYRLFFQIAINETISRSAHILHFINLYILKSEFIFEISVILIYFTDTNVLIFIAYSCYTMFELILKQNKRINTQFSLFLKIAYGFSVLMTGIFFMLSINNKQGKETDLYKNIIALNFIKDAYKNNKKHKERDLAPLLVTVIIYFLIVVYASYKVILIQLFIRKRGGEINEGEDEDNLADKKMHKSLKLKSFKNKMMQYPLLGIYFFVPLVIYSFIEKFKAEESSSLGYLKARYIFYNINCFMNSIRGWMFFRVFISNEKIKMFLFKNYLTSSVFYTIDKIKLKRERNISTISEDITMQSVEGSLFLDSSFGSMNKKINSDRSEKDSDDEIKETELNKKDRSFDDYNISNGNEENENTNKNIFKDTKSETLQIKSTL